MKRRSSASSTSGIKQRKVEGKQTETKLKASHTSRRSPSTTSSSGNNNKLTQNVSTSTKSSKRSCNLEEGKHKLSDTNDIKVKSPPNPNQIHDIDGHEWNHLPHAVLARMFWYLDPIDRGHASATCKQWRHCYFYPNLWRDVQLCLSDKWGWKGAQMVAERCGKYVHSLSIFPYTNLTCTENSVFEIYSIPRRLGRSTLESASESAGPIGITVLLEKLKDQSKNLEAFHLKWIIDESYLPDFDEDTSHNKAMKLTRLEDLIWKHLTPIIEGAKSMQHLTLGRRVNVIGRTGRLEQLAKLCGDTLRSLHCDVFTLENLSVEPSISPNMELFNGFRQLTDLRLNLVYVTDELLGILASPGRDCVMKSLGILATSREDIDGNRDAGGSNNAWEKLVAHSPLLSVNISYQTLACHQVTLERLLRKPAMPLQQLKILYRRLVRVPISDVVFDLIQSNFNHVLKRFEVLVNRYSRGIDSPQPNPIVLTMYRCRKITQLILTGYKIDADDLVGIARLGGPTMKLLGVQGSQIQYEHPWRSKKKLNAEISKCLGEDWCPMDEAESNKALWGFVDEMPLPGNKYGSEPVA